MPRSRLIRLGLHIAPILLAQQAGPACSLMVVAGGCEFSRQEYWSGLPFPSQGDLPNPGIEPKVPRVCRFIDTIAEWGRRGGELLNEFNVSVVNIENTMMDRMVEHYKCLIPLICTF